MKTMGFTQGTWLKCPNGGCNLRTDVKPTYLGENLVSNDFELIGNAWLPELVTHTVEI